MEAPAGISDSIYSTASSYGVPGGILLLFGIWKLAHRKDWRQIGVFLILPVFVILFYCGSFSSTSY